MLQQISAAVGFFLCLIRDKHVYRKDQMDHFRDRLSNKLLEKFRNHWYPNNPIKGNAYRCIRISRSSKREPLLEDCCAACGINYNEFLRRLPPEFTIWIDPNEVSYRLGEKRNPTTLVSFNV
nr:protein BTG4-like [Halyomorpha halys]